MQMVAISPDIRRGAKIELARRDFFSYCEVKTPSFYKPDRQYLVNLADTFQVFYEEDDENVLVVNVPPRHGKSLSATHFAQWVFGINPSEKIMTGSYNETLSTQFSKQVRNGIQETKAQPDQIVYNDIFPNTRIKYGDSAMNLWSLEGQYNNYLATSPTGTATGFGASLLIVDDLIKNSEEAFNDNVLEKHWQWFTNTMLSRLEKNGKIIIIMTRWHSEDLAGRALKELPELGFKVKHVNLKAVQDDGSMLCDDVLNHKEYKMRTSAMSPEIASANYQQEPIDIQGRLYSEFKTYPLDDVPEFGRIIAYTDTADEGDDYLATFIAGETLDGEAYILDIYYTQDGMEITEPEQAYRFIKHDTNIAWIESNSGGRGYARAVKRIMKNDFNWNKTIIKTFHQSKNKKARILSNSTWVMDHIYFPEGWERKWPEAYEALNKFQRKGKNAHDDLPDALTGIAERVGSRGGVSVLK